MQRLIAIRVDNPDVDLRSLAMEIELFTQEELLLDDVSVTVEHES